VTEATLAATSTMGAARETTVATVSISASGNCDGNDGGYGGGCYGGLTTTTTWSIKIIPVDPAVVTTVVVRMTTVAAVETTSIAREAMVAATMTTVVMAMA
jgi:hypothetical protein